MKILFICHRFPYPPARGGKIRPFNIIRHLSTRGEVTVASLVRSAEERRAGEGLAQYCRQIIVRQIGPLAAGWRMVIRLPTATPSSFGYFWSSLLAADIRRELNRRRYDLIFVHCSSVARYVEDAKAALKILDFGDMDSEKWAMYSGQRRFPLSVGFWLEAIKLRREERRLAAVFDLCTCTTPAEFESLRALGSARQTGWFPNGVDTDYFRPADRPYDPDLVCFSGRMDYFPNQQAVQRFCAQILPKIRRQRPETKFLIIGAEPPAAIRRLARQPGVTVTGTVPDVRPYVQSAAISVAPLLVARGTQNKILESMAMGVPVVCSPLAARGVDAVPGEHVLTAQNDDEFVETVLELLRDPARRAALAVRARQRILSHHRWEYSMARLDALINQCLAGNVHG